jgi:hypothetical protein
LPYMLLINLNLLYILIEIQGAIIENTFTSIKGMVTHILPKCLSFLSILVTKMKYPNIERIAKINVPCLFIIGKYFTQPKKMKSSPTITWNCCMIMLRHPASKIKYKNH